MKRHIVKCGRCMFGHWHDEPCRNCSGKIQKVPTVSEQRYQEELQQKFDSKVRRSMR